MPRKKATSAEDPKQELKLDAVEPQGLTAVNGARLSTSEVGNEPENISQDVSPEGTSEANEAMTPSTFPFRKLLSIRSSRTRSFRD